jgi:hypothetical protein
MPEEISPAGFVRAWRKILSTLRRWGQPRLHQD